MRARIGRREQRHPVFRLSTRFRPYHRSHYKQSKSKYTMQESLPDPIKLIPEVATYQFDTSLAEKSYVLCIGRERFEISEGIYQIIELIDGKKNLSEIASEYSAVRNKIYSSKDVYTVIHSFLRPYGILENTKLDVQIDNSYFYFQYPIIRENVVHAISNVLKFLYNPKILFFFVSLSIVFFLYFYFFYFKLQILLFMIFHFGRLFLH